MHVINVMNISNAIITKYLLAQLGAILRILARALGVVNVEQVAIILIIHLSLFFQLFTFLTEG